MSVGNILILLGLTLVFVLTDIPIGFTQECQQGLEPDPNKKMQYRDRGNRCEGLYQRKVSNTLGRIDIVGLTEGKFHYKLTKEETITLTAPSIPNQSLNIRSMGISLKTYYRMDAIINTGNPLIWPVADVLRPGNISSHKIGVYGWIGTNNDKKYVPLKIETTSEFNNQDRKIYLYARSSTKIKNVQWRSGDVGSGECRLDNLNPQWIKAEKEVYYGGDAIIIPLDSGCMKDNCIEIIGQTTSGTWLSPSKFKLITQHQLK